MACASWLGRAHAAAGDAGASGARRRQQRRPGRASAGTGASGAEAGARAGGEEDAGVGAAVGEALPLHAAKASPSAGIEADAEVSVEVGAEADSETEADAGVEEGALPGGEGVHERAQRLAVAACGGDSLEAVPVSCTAAAALARQAGAGEDGSAAALLRPLSDAGALGADDVEAAVSPAVAALLHESERCRDAPRRVDALNEQGAAAVRAYILATCSPKAVLVDACVRLVGLRAAVRRGDKGGADAHAQADALEALLVSAPLAHALGAGGTLWELEDAAFRALFPTSFTAVSAWLDEAWAAGEAVLGRARPELEAALAADSSVRESTARARISARAKGLFSTFSKLLRDGRGTEGVRDLLGIRVVLDANPSTPEGEAAACYAAMSAARDLWHEVPGRAKDYVSRPKASGYQALHSTFVVEGMTVELQIRGAGMHAAAEHGAASHAAYKLGVATRRPTATPLLGAGDRGASAAVHATDDETAGNSGTRTVVQGGAPLLPGLAQLPDGEAKVLAAAAEALVDAEAYDSGGESEPEAS